METERLVIRRLTMQDTEALLAIMGKPEVMYAWEHGFTHADVVQWIGRQLARYRDDGYGYFALELKGEGKVIGQAGLMKTAINGREAVELGYILDDSYWHRGYAVEAARECLRYASADLGLAEVYCSIRPQNTASIRVALALGMKQCGSHTVIYRGKEMPHLLFSKASGSGCM